MAGTANAASQWTFSSSVKVSGDINVDVRGNGATGNGPANQWGIGNPFILKAFGRGDGELTVRITGPKGFGRVYSLELNPLVVNKVEVQFIASDGLTTGDIVTLDVPHLLKVDVILDTTGLTGQYKLSASVSGSLTTCLALLDDPFANLFPNVGADQRNTEPGQGSLKASSILELFQN